MANNVGASRPLDNFPLIRSRNLEEVGEAIARVYAKPNFLVERGIEADDTFFNNCSLRHVSFAYGAYGTAVEMDFPATGFFSQLFPLRGKGEIICGQSCVEMTAGTSAVISSGSPHYATFSADYEQLVLRIDARMLTEKLSAMTGNPIDKPLHIEPQQHSRHPAAQMLQQYIPLLVDTLGNATLPFPDWWVAQTEQLLMTLFLCGYRHNYSHFLDEEMPDVAPRQVRAAEDYIEANALRAITLEELAEITGVSTFSLFRSFKKSRGLSPLEFANQIRLRRAYRLLRRPAADTTVRDVALYCGFADFSRFNREYIEAFGEPPSQTLRRSGGESSILD